MQAGFNFRWAHMFDGTRTFLDVREYFSSAYVRTARQNLRAISSADWHACLGLYCAHEPKRIVLHVTVIHYDNTM